MDRLDAAGIDRAWARPCSVRVNHRRYGADCQGLCQRKACPAEFQRLLHLTSSGGWFFRAAPMRRAGGDSLSQCDRHLRAGARTVAHLKYGCRPTDKRRPGRQLPLRDIPAPAEHRGVVLRHEQRQRGSGRVAGIGQGENGRSLRGSAPAGTRPRHWRATKRVCALTGPALPGQSRLRPARRSKRSGWCGGSWCVLLERCAVAGRCTDVRGLTLAAYIAVR